MAAHKSQFRLHSMCRVLRVQRSGYYAWKKKPKSKRALADEFLLVKIKQSFESSQSIYGSPRVHCDLREDGVLCGEKRIARLMTRKRDSSIAAATNACDVTQGHGLLHGQESVLFADAGYQGAVKRPEATGVARHVAMRPGKRRVLSKNSLWGSLLDKAEQLKASVRAKVEHPFRVIKCQFGFTKVRYKGLAKNTAQLIDAVCAEQCVDGTKAFAGCTGMSEPAQRENARRRPEKAQRSSPNALEFGEYAARVSPVELSKFNSRYSEGSADLPLSIFLHRSKIVK